MLTVARFEQPLNAEVPIFLILLGRLAFVRLVQELNT